MGDMTVQAFDAEAIRDLIRRTMPDQSPDVQHATAERVIAMAEGGRYLIETSWVVGHVYRPLYEGAPREEIAACEWLMNRLLASAPAGHRADIQDALWDVFEYLGDLNSFACYAKTAIQRANGEV